MHFVICKYYQGLGSSRALRAVVVEASLHAPYLIDVFLPLRVF